MSITPNTLTDAPHLSGLMITRLVAKLSGPDSEHYAAAQAFLDRHTEKKIAERTQRRQPAIEIQTDREQWALNNLAFGTPRRVVLEAAAAVGLAAGGIAARWRANRNVDRAVGLVKRQANLPPQDAARNEILKEEIKNTLRWSQAENVASGVLLTSAGGTILHCLHLRWKEGKDRQPHTADLEGEATYVVNFINAVEKPLREKIEHMREHTPISDQMTKG